MTFEVGRQARGNDFGGIKQVPCSQQHPADFLERHVRVDTARREASVQSGLPRAAPLPPS